MAAQLLIDGEWRDLDRMIAGSVEEFVDAYLEQVEGLSFDDIERLNDMSTEQFAQERTSGPAIIDFFRYIGGCSEAPYRYRTTTRPARCSRASRSSSWQWERCRPGPTG